MRAMRSASSPLVENPRTGDQSKPAIRHYYLAAAILLVLTAIGIRAFTTLRNPGPRYLRLGDDVPLLAPPAFSDDLAETRERMRSVAEARSAARSSPVSRDAQLRYARTAAGSGDMLSARDGFRATAAKETTPTVEALDGLGRCEQHLGRYEEAAEIYRRLISSQPERAEGYVGLSRALLPQRKRSESLEVLERGAAEVSNPDGRLVLAREFERRGDLARALSLARMDGADSNARLTAARLSFKLEDLRQAIPDLERLTADDPQATEARRYLAAALINPLNPRPDTRRAEHLLLEAAQGKPGDPEALMTLGELYNDERRFRPAEHVLATYLRAVPASGPARLQLARAYRGLGDLKGSEEQRALGRRLTEAARTTERHRTVIGQRPKDARARAALARHLMDSGQFTGALPELQAAVALDPKNRALAAELSGLYRRIGAESVPGAG